VVGAESTIGHGAVLHGCTVRRGALIGMNCVVNDNADVGEDAVIAALAFVKAEERIPARSLAAGIPAKVRRTVTDEELAWKHANMLVYNDLAVRSMKTMREVEALTEAEKDRPRFHFPTSVPLSELKKQHG
jgi:phenylacetic acid degradation protein